MWGFMASRMVLIAGLLCGGVLCAQAQTAQPSPPAVENARSTSQASPQKLTSTGGSAPYQVGGLTVSGSLRLRLESWDWFETPAADNSYQFGAAVLRLGLGQQKEKFEWQVEGAFPLLVGLPDEAIAPAPQGQLGLGATYFASNGRRDASAILKQAFVRFKGLGHESSSLQIGRFEFADGTEVSPADATLAALKRDRIAHRLIGPFTFTHVGRSFDGVRYSRQTRSDNITFVAARPTEGVFQLRGMNELDVDFYYGAFTRPLKTRSSVSEMRVFALHYHDGRRTLKADNRPQSIRATDTDNIRLTTLGGHYLGAFSIGSGKADLLLWGVGQCGQWGTLAHRAGAVAVEAGYQPAGRVADRLKPWLRAGYFRSTGDGDPTDGTHRTFFQVLPTPRIYARFPFYNLMNNEDLFAQLMLRPHARLGLRSDLRYLRLSNARDQWYLGGGAFQAGSFGYTARPSGGRRALGTLADLSLDFALTPRTTLAFYLGGVRGGGVARQIYPEGPRARFAYLELTQRF
jgi:hypothetical protein